MALKFHTPSFLMGFASATVIAVSGKRLKPVAVELGSLGLHLAHLTWGLVERQREHVEDLWAEVEERARERRRKPMRGRKAPVTKTVRIEATPTSNGQEARH
ncbi:MAG: hypothetical protein IPM54_42730 [Polyangiaceae bacterium]|nr:hypothetical protein [Polyangiaceae bacterium]